MKFLLAIFIFLFGFLALAQDQNPNYITKKVVVKDTIKIDSVSINSKDFKVIDTNGRTIDSSSYSVDYPKAIITFTSPIKSDSISISYLRFPKFLTKTYQQLDDEVVITDTDNLQRIFKLKQSNVKNRFTPFDGLTTSGSISRGVTIGNNQNSVLNSELDLQITGKLNDKVSLRASIQDANIPLQESGYSQRLDEFDQVFIELFSDRWNVRAGDIDLQDNNSYFSQFNKRVQGLSLNLNFGQEEAKTQAFAAGALVRGQFTTSQFTAQEGNQGPYKLQGNNGELFVLIVSGSETVYVNGVPVVRGENEDYIIDYNAGEIIFNSTFPITSEMRITVDYQFSDRNYSRFIAYGGATHESEKLKVGVSIYSENDAKNQPLQQNLSTEQVSILADAGDDRTNMVAPSAVSESFSENRILYRKEFAGTEEIFVFSNDPEDELFSVRFSNVGTNNGNYRVKQLINDDTGELVNAIATIYEYIAPENGIPQGNFEPVIQLIAPTKLQLAVVNGSYKPTEKTQINFEIAGSRNDLNLFSSLDDSDNDGLAGKLKVNQQIIKNDSLWNLNGFVDTDFIQENFRNIEGLYNPEFNRDWNLEAQPTANQILNDFGNQLLLTSGLQLQHSKKGLANYTFEHLNYSGNFNGNRHSIFANLILNKLSIFSNSSFLKAESNTNSSTFLRSFNRLTYNFNKSWVGAKLAIEDNEQIETQTQALTPLSQKFSSYEIFTGIGDSTRVFAQIGYKNRVNDSIRNNRLETVNTSNTYYLDTRLIQNTNSNLSLYVNFRKLNNKEDTIEDEQSLNSRLQYNQKLFDQIINWNTIYETNSGTLPRQDFTYVEVEPGQGAYTWIDYNENGIQELEEFETAPFQDQGNFIRVLLPNQVFLKTHQNRLSQTVTLNMQKWSGSNSKTKKFWSHFYNQASYLLDRKELRTGNNFNLNPFKNDDENQLALQLNFRNLLIYNRGKQRYTTSYTYLNNKSRNELSFGFIENNLESHQIRFLHKFAISWLIDFQSIFENTESISENFLSKNFNIDDYTINPKLSYLLNDNTRFDVFYQFSNQENTIGEKETLLQQRYGTSFTFNKNEKAAITGEFNYFSNDFEGNANAPVGYQMMQGLQPGKNFTWSLIAQKKLTKFLDLNLNYLGRKSETSRVIHTGNIQLRAYF